MVRTCNSKLFSTSLRLKVAYALCKDICILGEAALALDLVSGTSGDTVFKTLIDSYFDRVPLQANSPELAIESVVVRGPA